MKVVRDKVLLLTAGLLLAGCAPAAPLQDQPAAAGSAVKASALPSMAAGRVDDVSGESLSSVAEPRWDEHSRMEAIIAAEKLMNAFARPNLDEATWWAAMEPLLSAEARLMYSAVDPANVPPEMVTGAGELLDEASAYIARVQVPTNVGPYTVILSRDSATAVWEGERITPPEGVN